MSVIDAIYNGEYYPSEQVTPDSAIFAEHAANAQRLSERLEALLSAEQRDALDAYKSEAAVVTDLYNVEFYRAGVQFGVRLLLEALSDGAEPTEIHK